MFATVHAAVAARELGAVHAWDQIKDYLIQLQERGVLRQTDPAVVTAHLKGLLEAGVVEPLLYGANAWFTPKAAATAAVDAFLRIYGNEPAAAGCS